MDPEVITLPWIFRFLLVYGIIALFRGPRSAALYKKIWTAKGSPLMCNTQDLTTQLKAELPDYRIEFAFRYQEPSIQTALETLRANQVTELLIFPLYPQFATSTTRTTLNSVLGQRSVRRSMRVQSLLDFYDQEFYIDSITQLISKPQIKSHHFVFSFHGLPTSHLTSLYSGCAACLKKSSIHCKPFECCDPKNTRPLCYKKQCLQSAAIIAERLGLPSDQFTVSFQSRLGKDQWIEPSTEATLVALAKEGKKQVTLLAPGFVSDCLETLEELDDAAKHTFLAAGGLDFIRVPCLNSNLHWAKNLAQFIRSADQPHSTGVSKWKDLDEIEKLLN